MVSALSEKRFARIASRIFLYVGDILVAEDRKRVVSHKATSFFILPAMNSVDPEGEDRENVVKALCLRKYHASVRTILLLHKAEFRPLLGKKSENMEGGGSLNEALLRQMASQEDKQQMVQVGKEGIFTK